MIIFNGAKYTKERDVVENKLRSQIETLLKRIDDLKNNPVKVPVNVTEYIPVAPEIVKVFSVSGHKLYYTSLEAIMKAGHLKKYGKTVTEHEAIVDKEGKYYVLSGVQPIEVEE